MAPEQLNGGVVDVRADVFAFGAVLYEYISGVHPFAAATPLATVARVLESDARPLVRAVPARAGRGARVRGAVPAESARPSGSGRPRHRAWRSSTPTSRSSRAPAAPGGGRISSSSSASISPPRRSPGKSRNGSRCPRPCRCSSPLGVGAAIGGVLRGHLVFTEQINRRNLGDERRRAGTALIIVDVLMAAALVADATMLAAWPLTAVLTMGLGDCDCAGGARAGAGHDESRAGGRVDARD